MILQICVWLLCYYLPSACALAYVNVITIQLLLICFTPKPLIPTSYTINSLFFLLVTPRVGMVCINVWQNNYIGRPFLKEYMCIWVFFETHWHQSHTNYTPNTIYKSSGKQIFLFVSLFLYIVCGVFARDDPPLERLHYFETQKLATASQSCCHVCSKRTMNPTGSGSLGVVN